MRHFPRLVKTIQNNIEICKWTVITTIKVYCRFSVIILDRVKRTAFSNVAVNMPQRLCRSRTRITDTISIYLFPR